MGIAAPGTGPPRPAPAAARDLAAAAVRGGMRARGGTLQKRKRKIKRRGDAARRSPLAYARTLGLNGRQPAAAEAAGGGQAGGGLAQALKHGRQPQNVGKDDKKDLAAADKDAVQRGLGAVGRHHRHAAQPEVHRVLHRLHGAAVRVPRARFHSDYQALAFVQQHRGNAHAFLPAEGHGGAAASKTAEGAAPATTCGAALPEDRRRNRSRRRKQPAAAAD